MSNNMEDKELEGLNYEELVLDQNVHKLIGTVNKTQGGNSAEVKVDDGAMWLVTGLGYLQDSTPDNLLSESLNDTIIISKSDLIKFIKNK